MKMGKTIDAELPEQVNENSEKKVEVPVEPKKEEPKADKVPNSTLDELFNIACEVYKPSIERIINKVNPKNKPYLEGDTLKVVLTFLNLRPGANNSDYQITKSDDVPDNILEYLLQIDEAELKKLDKKEVIDGLPETRFISNQFFDLTFSADKKDYIVSADLIALATDANTRLILGTVIKTAQDDKLPCSTSYFPRDKIGSIVIPSSYFIKTAKKYNRPVEEYLSAMKKFEDAKKAFRERWGK
jgi:hypothetical protein